MDGGSGCTRVLIVDDHALLAESLAVALRAHGLVVEVADVTSAASILGAADALAPDLVLLDLDLRAGLPGESLIEPLRRAGAQVLVVTASGDAGRLGECLLRGANGILDKSQPLDVLLRAALDTADLSTLPAPAQRIALLTEQRQRRAAQQQHRATFGALTARERQVLAGLLDGKQAEALASEFVVSQATIRTQISSLLRKLGVNSQLAAVALARRAGWSYDPHTS